MSTTIAPSRQSVARGMSLIGLTATAHLLVDGSVSFLSVLLPTFRDRFDLTTLETSVLVAVLAITTALTQPLFGAVADRIGQRGLVVAGVITTTTLLPLSAWAPNVGIVVAVLAIGGLGSGAFHPAATTAIRGTSDSPEAAVGLLTAGGMVGLAIGPVALLLVVAAIGPPGLAVISLAGAGVAAMLWRRLPAGGASRARGKLFDRRLLRGAPARLTLAVALASLSAITFLNATPMALVADGRAATDPTIGLVLATFTGAAAVGTVVGGVLASRLGRRPVVVGSMLAAVVPLIVTVATGPTVVTYWIAVAAAGALVHLALPTMVVAAQEAVPGAEGAATGLVVGGAMGAAGVAYIAVGHLQGVLGIPTASVVAFAALIPAAWVAARALPGGRAAKSARHDAMPCICFTPA